MIHCFEKIKIKYNLIWLCYLAEVVALSKSAELSRLVNVSICQLMESESRSIYGHRRWSSTSLTLQLMCCPPSMTMLWVNFKPWDHLDQSFFFHQSSDFFMTTWRYVKMYPPWEHKKISISTGEQRLLARNNLYGLLSICHQEVIEFNGLVARLITRW